MDPYITIILANTLLYISGERYDLPQCPNLTLHSDILHIGCPSIRLYFIPESLACKQQTYFTHIGSKKTGLKWASQLITQIWKLVYGKWLHRSKINHVGEVLEDNTKELILSAEITKEHIQGQDTGLVASTHGNLYVTIISLC